MNKPLKGLAKKRKTLTKQKLRDMWNVENLKDRPKLTGGSKEAQKSSIKKKMASKSTTKIEKGRALRNLLKPLHNILHPKSDRESSANEMNYQYASDNSDGTEITSDAAFITNGNSDTNNVHDEDAKRTVFRLAADQETELDCPKTVPMQVVDVNVSAGGDFEFQYISENSVVAETPLGITDDSGKAHRTNYNIENSNNVDMPAEDDKNENVFPVASTDYDDNIEIVGYDDNIEIVGYDDNIEIVDYGDNVEVDYDQCENPYSIELIDTNEVLNDSPFSSDVLTRYGETRELSDNDRTIIADSIVDYAWIRKIRLSFFMMSRISYDICKVFRTETPSTYYRVSAGNAKSGILYQRYQYKRKLRNRESKVQHDDDDDDEVSEDVENSIVMLRQEGKTEDYYLEHWEKTFEYRTQQYTHYEGIDQLLYAWPIIGKPLGPTLVKLDFARLYGEKTITSAKWRSLFTQNWRHFQKKIKSPKGKTCSRKVDRLTDQKSKDAAYSYLLHYLLPPALATRLKKGERKTGKKKGRKPSIADSRNTVFQFIKHEDVDLVIMNRKTQCEVNKIKQHPFIVGHGISRYEIVHFYVVLGDFKFKVEDFIAALDLTFKMFILFNIPFPKESKAVWIFLNKVFFDINVSRLMTARICTLFNDIKK